MGKSLPVLAESSCLIPQSRFFSGPTLPMMFILIGMGLLSFYLNPWWLKLKVMQVGGFRPQSLLINFVISVTIVCNTV